MTHAGPVEAGEDDSEAIRKAALATGDVEVPAKRHRVSEDVSGSQDSEATIVPEYEEMYGEDGELEGAEVNDTVFMCTRGCAEIAPSCMTY